MNLIKIYLLAGILLASNALFARGGDDVGNGGFAYKQSVIVLKMATKALRDIKSIVPELSNYHDYGDKKLGCIPN